MSFNASKPTCVDLEEIFEDPIIVLNSSISIDSKPNSSILLKLVGPGDLGATKPKDNLEN